MLYGAREKMPLNIGAVRGVLSVNGKLLSNCNKKRNIKIKLAKTS
jgi:hypothetical protein